MNSIIRIQHHIHRVDTYVAEGTVGFNNDGDSRKVWEISNTLSVPVAPPGWLLIASTEAAGNKTEVSYMSRPASALGEHVDDPELVKSRIQSAVWQAINEHNMNDFSKWQHDQSQKIVDTAVERYFAATTEAAK